MENERKITMTITVPEDVDDDFGGIGIMLESEGVPREVGTVLILGAVEAIMRGDIAEEQQQKLPLATQDYIQAIAATSARLKLVDTIMHLPMSGGEVVGFMVDMSPQE